MGANGDALGQSPLEERPGDLAGLVHDLRQPVAAIRFVLGALCGRVDLPGDVPALVDQLDTYARWMSDLLRLPMADPHGSDGADREAGTASGPHLSDLGTVAAVAASAAGQAHMARLVLEPLGTATVLVDETDLRRALGNLLDNAFRAAGPSGTVRVRVGTGDGIGFVTVDDDGPGFGRVESGSRLGLSLVAELALSVGGRLEFSGSDLGGVRTRLQLPVHSPELEQALDMSRA